MLMSNSLLAAQLFPSPIPTFQKPSHAPPLKFNQNPAKDTQPNLEETQQIHAHLIKTCFNCSYQFPFAALQNYSSELSLYSFLITSYINNNLPGDAVKIYAHMRKTDTEVDSFIVPSVLKACCLILSIRLGEELHGFVVKNGLDTDVFVCNALIQMYSECGSLKLALMVFDKMQNRDVVSWSTMIRSYSRSGLRNEALDLLREMHIKGFKPSIAAMVSIVNVFIDCEDSKLGKVMHAYVVRNQNNEISRVPLTTALINMYAICKNLVYAKRLFYGLCDANIVSWTAIISGCIHCNDLNEGVKLLVKMLNEGMFPNEITMISFFKECGFIEALELGKCLHAFTLRNGFTITLILATALIDMYGKCGDFRSARSVFDSITNRDLTMWGAMISAYAQANCIDQAFDIFFQMTGCGIRPNEVTIASLLSPCAKAGALDIGKWLHAYIDKQGIKVDMILRTSLMDMYAKCGDIDAAHRLFTDATDRDILMCNTMISGFAIHGYGQAALELFTEMERLGVIPNETTFIGALHACSHAGLVLEGKRLFEKMVHRYNLVPNVQHYGCLVDLLGRARLLDEAYELINHMPLKPNMVVLGSLLAACKLHKNVKLGEWAAKQFLSLEPEKCGYNVLMSNIYAAANRWDDVAGIRRAMKDEGIRKEPGISSIEVNGSVHDFVMGDQAHPEAQKIYDMIAEMRGKLEDAGYIPDTSPVLQNIDGEDGDVIKTLKENEYEYTWGNMTVRLAEAFGFCWRVERAVQIAYEARKHFPTETIWLTNEIIHNPTVNKVVEDVLSRCLT